MTEPQAYSQKQLVSLGTLSRDDVGQVMLCRRDHNKLGFAYQLIFVKLNNFFPNYEPFELLHEILTFASVQINIEQGVITSYTKRQQTIYDHQNKIRDYLQLQKFDETIQEQLELFIFNEALRLENSNIILIKTQEFLRGNKWLRPSLDTLRRIIGAQKEKAKSHIYQSINSQLNQTIIDNLDTLIATDEDKNSQIEFLKTPPSIASPKSMLVLIDKLKLIKGIGVRSIEINLVSNNYQRLLFKYANRCSAHRLRQLEEKHRYTVLVCFLLQIYQDTVDYIIDTHFKLMGKVYKSAKNELIFELHQQRKNINNSLTAFNKIGNAILDDNIQNEQLREAIFKKISKNDLMQCINGTEEIISGKYSDTFHLVTKRYSYLRQFAPALLEHIEFESNGSSDIIEAIDTLKELNDDNKRKLPDDAPTNFIPSKLQKIIEVNGEIKKADWEVALLTKIRDEIKAGNLSVTNSKRFDKFDNFFMPDSEWKKIKSAFLKKAKLPENPDEVGEFLTQRLNTAYDNFLATDKQNSYAKVENDKWILSVDPALELTPQEEADLNKLKNWLSKHMEPIKLPDLLISVDNELHLTRHFMPPNKQSQREVDDVCTVIATMMAHGCFIGTDTMARLTPGISYGQIKHVTDWYLTEEAQRNALVEMVSAISNLDITKVWGEGKTSSSDGQRFEYQQSVLNQQYSTRFGDLALEFYTFMADNYAPFYSTPMECTDRDAPYVLDGILYNETELALDEHYTDTHGFTEINYTAFGMYGKTYSPRIKNVKTQRIYKIDTAKNYGSLSPLIATKDRIIHMNWIIDDWDRMGQFYASLENGYATASVALKRLVTFNGKNHFYRANRELGRIFKTENILNYMSDPLLRKNRRKGLLKGEQIHQLARNVAYGKRGKVSARDLYEQKNTCSCLTLILSCIIYWQAREIKRIIDECNPEADNINLKMLEHISPIGWSNVLLYGEYLIDKKLVK
jgi:TnpA family transposase